MTLEFFMASATITVLGTFLFKYFSTAIASAQGNTITGLLSIVAYVLILGIMGISLINGSFSVMMKLADTIIGFIGFIGSSGHSAFNHDTESKVNTLFVSAASRIGQGARMGAGGGGGATRGTLGTVAGATPAAGPGGAGGNASATGFLGGR